MFFHFLCRAFFRFPCPVKTHEMRRSMVIPGFWTQKHRHWDLKQKGWRLGVEDLLKMSMFFNHVFLYSCIPWHTWSTHTDTHTVLLQYFFCCFFIVSTKLFQPWKLGLLGIETTRLYTPQHGMISLHSWKLKTSWNFGQIFSLHFQLQRQSARFSGGDPRGKDFLWTSQGP